MGTRSLTYVYSEYSEYDVSDPGYGKPLVCMYRQYDGYREGHGKELAEFLKPIQLISGIPIGVHPADGVRLANSMGCLAAQLIAHFKKDVGGFYLNPPDVVANAEGWQEYEYHVFPNRVTVTSCGANSETIFTGSWKEFYDWCMAEEPEEEEILDEEVSLSIDDLPVALQKGIVTVTFNKSDGSRRVMRCTRNPDYFPTLPENTSGQKTDPNLFKVWDVEAKGWRSFRKERIISITQ